MTLKLLYFAWVRDRIGQAEEAIDVPGDLQTVDDLLTWLSERSEGHALAFADRNMIRAALDQEHVQLDSALEGASELALFPPVTGG